MRLAIEGREGGCLRREQGWESATQGKKERLYYSPMNYLPSLP